MTIFKAYQYLFYKLYSFYETSTYSRWWSDWKSLVTIIVMEIWTFFSLAFYYQAITGKSANELTWFNTFIWSISIVIGVWNWYIFVYQDKWKDVVNEFDELPKKKNRIGSFIVLFVVLVSIANLVFSVYILSQSVGNVPN
jgi:hypothetical protein